MKSWTHIVLTALFSTLSMCFPLFIQANTQDTSFLIKEAPSSFNPEHFTQKQLDDIKWILNYRDEYQTDTPLLTVDKVTVENGELVVYLLPTAANQIGQSKNLEGAANILTEQIYMWQQEQFRYYWLIHLHYLPPTPYTIRLYTTFDMTYAVDDKAPKKQPIVITTPLIWEGFTED